MKKSFTLIELLVVIAIIGILAGMLLPSLTAARESARNVACISNLSQIGKACVMYSNNNASYLPGVNTGVTGKNDVSATDKTTAPYRLLRGGYMTGTRITKADDFQLNYVKLFQCPSDRTVFNANGGTGAISYLWFILPDKASDGAVRRQIVGRDDPGAAIWADYPTSDNVQGCHPVQTNILRMGFNVDTRGFEDAPNSVKVFDATTY